MGKPKLQIMASSKELLQKLGTQLTELGALLQQIAAVAPDILPALGLQVAEPRGQSVPDIAGSSDDGVLVGQFKVLPPRGSLFEPQSVSSVSSEQEDSLHRDEQEESDGIKSDNEPDSESDREPSSDASFSSSESSSSDGSSESSSEGSSEGSDESDPEEEETPVKRPRSRPSDKAKGRPPRRSKRAHKSVDRYVPTIDAKADRRADEAGEDLGAPSRLRSEERTDLCNALGTLESDGWTAFLTEPWTKRHLTGPLRIILNAWGRDSATLSPFIMDELKAGTLASVCERMPHKKHTCSLCKTTKPCSYHIEGLGPVGKVCGDLFMAIMDLGQLCNQLASEAWFKGDSATWCNDAWQQFHESMTQVQTIHASKGGGTRRSYKRSRRAAQVEDEAEQSE
jgi:hypothetical protein